MKSACLVCGAEYSNDFIYCEYCGTRLRRNKANIKPNITLSQNPSSVTVKSPNLLPNEMKYDNSTSFSSQKVNIQPNDLISNKSFPFSNQYVLKRKIRIYARASLLFLLVLIVTSPILNSSFMGLFSFGYNSGIPLEYVETLDYYIDDDINLTKLNLYAYDTGSVTINIQPDLDYYFHVTMLVFAGGDYLDNPYEEPEDHFRQDINDTVLDLVFYHSRYLQYELIITISSDLILNIDLDAIRGDLSFSATSSHIKSFDSYCYGDLSFSANSTYIEFLRLDGRKVTSLFRNVVFKPNSRYWYDYDIWGSNVRATFLDSIFLSNNTVFSIYSGSELILQIDQDLYDDDCLHSINYDIRAYTVYCTYRFSSIIGTGYNITGGIKSDNIKTSGFPSPSSYPYFSSNYIPSCLQFFFDMEWYGENGSVTITSI